MFISDSTDLMPFIPNAVAPAMGDRTYFDKLAPYVTEAEQWLSTLVCSEEQAGADTILRASLREAVATHALYTALPMLDIVITPNGVATVGGGESQTFVPASTARTESARASLLQRRDRALSSAIALLRRRADWRESEQGRWWGSTLFPELGWPLAIDDREQVSLAVYLNRRPKVEDIETRLTDDWIGRPLMERLRRSLQLGSLSTPERDLATRLREEVLHCIRHDVPPRYDRMRSVINLIRSDRTLDIDWVNTAAADNFRLPAFVNDRMAGGYFM